MIFFYLADLAVVTLGCLSQECLIVRKLLFIWEGYAVDPLKSVIVGVSKEVRSRALLDVSAARTQNDSGEADFRDHECFDPSCMRDMRSNTQVHHRATSIHSCRSTIGNLAFYEMPFILIILHGKVVRYMVRYIDLHAKLTENISNRVSLGTISRSNFCFSLIAESDIFSNTG